MTEGPYKTIAVAATFSPRFHQVLAEANRIRERFGAKLNIIYVGKKDAASAAKFSEAITQLKLPADSALHYHEHSDPATAILGAAENTVKKHLQNVFEKIGVDNRNAATMSALEVLGAPH